MTRYKAHLWTTDRDLASRVAGALTELLEPAPDAQTLFELGTGWAVEAYFAQRVDGPLLGACLASLIMRDVPPIAVTAIPDQNWVAISQAALPPVRAGRFLVHGSHDSLAIPRGPHTLEIDAGEAFGTAHHATTRGCLVAIDRISRRRIFKSVLDVGCGSGILALAACRAFPHARVRAVDNDPIAVLVARANARRNGLAARVVVSMAHAPTWSREAGAHDLIIANILAAPLMELAPYIARSVAPGGRLILSGLLACEAGVLIARYGSLGLTVEGRCTDAGWTILTLQKISARARSRAMRSRHVSNRVAA